MIHSMIEGFVTFIAGNVTTESERKQDENRIDPPACLGVRFPGDDPTPERISNLYHTPLQGFPLNWLLSHGLPRNGLLDLLNSVKVVFCFWCMVTFGGNKPN